MLGQLAGAWGAKEQVPSAAAPARRPLTQVCGGVLPRTGGSAKRTSLLPGCQAVHAEPADRGLPPVKQVKAMVSAVNLGNQCERPCRKYSKHFPSCNIRK